jgi:hypothetical protein
MKDFKAKEASSPPERKSTSYQSTVPVLRSGSGSGIHIRIGNARSREIDQKEQINLISSLSKWLLCLRRYVLRHVTYMRYIFHVQKPTFCYGKV